MRALPLRAPMATLLILLGLVSLCLPSQAQAVTYNISDVKSHGRWQSLVLSLGKERYVRALDETSYSDSVLSLNARPNACRQPWLELRVELAEYQPESTTHSRVPADVRVDHRTIHSGSAAFITERGNSGFYVRFTLPTLALLLDEMAAGELMRLRIMRAADDPWFMAFGLEGAGPALERANRLCERYSD